MFSIILTILCHIRNNDVIKHYRIVKKPSSGRYEIFGNSRSFPAMKVLVDYHHKCAISVDGEILSIPCPKEVGVYELYGFLYSVCYL